MRRADVLMDVGKPLNPRIDIGQVEGAFIQGFGLVTMEEKVYLTGAFLTGGLFHCCESGRISFTVLERRRG